MRENDAKDVFGRLVASYIHWSKDVQEFREAHLGGQPLEKGAGTAEVENWIKKQSPSPLKNLDALINSMRWLMGEKEEWIPAKEIVKSILTGDIPIFNIANASCAFDTLWGKKIIIHASPHARPADVVEAFEKAKDAADIDTKERRKLSAKTVRLAEFVLKHEGSWQNRMDKWNAKYPKWYYKDRRRFARDAKAAVERGGFGVFTV